VNSVQKASLSDITQIHRLVNQFASRGEMLARSLSELYEDMRDFFVVRDGERLLGCVALHISWEDLAEIKALAVAEDCRRLGIASQLIERCLAEAREMGIKTVFCLTYVPALFERHGFTRIDKMELPRKVWTECYRCPKFPDCDEIALTYPTGA